MRDCAFGDLDGLSADAVDVDVNVDVVVVVVDC